MNRKISAGELRAFRLGGSGPLRLEAEEVTRHLHVTTPAGTHTSPSHDGQAVEVLPEQGSA